MTPDITAMLPERANRLELEAELAGAERFERVYLVELAMVVWWHFIVRRRARRAA